MPGQNGKSRDKKATDQGSRSGSLPRLGPPAELVEAKLSRPFTRQGTVLRERLVGRLGASPVPIMAVVAPAGFGKTTLLGQWAEQDARPFAWLSIDRFDNDPVVLLTYVAEALDRIEPIGPAVFEALGSPDVSVLATVVPRLGLALASMRRPFVLVLEDAHLLDNRGCLDALEALARRIPQGSQVAITAREHHSLPQPLVHGRGRVLQIGARDLTLSQQEARELLRAEGVELPDVEALELYRRTEGWPVALYLAVRAIRAGELRDVAAFTGDDRLIADYLRLEFLPRLLQDEVRFLTRTAVLDRMCGPLCDAILGSGGSAGVLDRLERVNPLVVPLDRDHHWYRYHHLLQELLRAELERREPDLVPRLLGRASDWCDASGDPAAAVRYAQASGDVDRVAWLLAMYVQPFYRQGRAVALEGWLEWFDQRAPIHQYPAVAVLGSLIHALRGHPAADERWIDAAEHATREMPLPDGTTSIGPWIALSRALLCRQGVDRMRVDAEIAVRMIAAESWFHPAAALFLGTAHLLAGKADEADRVLAEAVEKGQLREAWPAMSVALAERALLAIDAGQWEAAEAMVDRASAVVRASGLQEYVTSTLVYAVSARLAFHRGAVPQAREELARAHRLRPKLTHALPHLAVQTLLELTRTHLALADAAGARTLLREVDLLLERRPDLGVLVGQAEELRDELKTVQGGTLGASTLTSAELRLLPYLSTHLLFREISQRLYVSHNTVKKEAISIYRKLGVTSRSQAIARAQQLGLLDS
jgi:LuxR family transcriptional regulator, maltose regulon positive regulatory protein